MQLPYATHQVEHLSLSQRLEYASWAAALLERDRQEACGFTGKNKER